MKKRFISSVISVLFVLSIFISCETAPKYGYFEISGTVTDSITSLPLQNIRVIREGTDYLLFGDTVYSDNNGKYSLTLSDYYAKRTSFILKIEDFDEKKNGGEYLTRKVKVPFSGTDFVDISGSSEYNATASKIYNIKLQLKN